MNTYTVQVDQPELDELAGASEVARHVGAKAPIVQNFRHADTLAAYPRLIRAAEAPVVDTSCAALLMLAERVHANGQKVVLTGEGSDEWLLGYPWYKIAKALSFMDVMPKLQLSERFRRAMLGLNKVPHYPLGTRARWQKHTGGPNAWLDAYGLLGLSKLRFYAEPMRQVLATAEPWADLQMPVERAARWAPQNRGVWVAAKVTLGGMLLQAKGDRVAMHSSVEVRYPFLDEAVFDFTAKLHPKWKLHGFRDKHLLRLVAARWLPKSVYDRRKVIFRAPLDSFHVEPAPYVDQLLSEESLRKTGYFDVKEVRHWRTAYKTLGAIPRLSVEGGLAAVVATQLWHHTYIDGTLCELPG